METPAETPPSIVPVNDVVSDPERWTRNSALYARLVLFVLESLAVSGSTADDVRAAYPGLEKTIDTWEPPIGGYREYVAPTTDGHWLHFDTTGGASGAEDIVTTIVINDTKAATQDVCR